MRIAYLDCFAGISGDMFLAALLDAGVDPAVLHQATAALELNATLRISTVDRSGISSIKVDVLEGGELAEAPHDQSEAPHTHELVQQQQHTHQPQPKTQQLHKVGHSHDHEHPHTHAPDEAPEHSNEHGHEHSHEHSHEQAHEQAQEHSHGRSLTAIRTLIQASGLSPVVKQTAIHIFELLGTSEAKIHNVDVEHIHFHEVGAVDAIVDIVAASAGIHALNDRALADTGQPLQWYASALNVGGGMVDCAHGRFPVPAPATADLLRGMPTYSAHIQKELVTPTGAAILRALNPTFGPHPAMCVRTIGYGAGTRNPKDFPNVLRLSLGDTDEAKAEARIDPGLHAVTVLETALDDLSPQILATLIDRALALGAHDAMLTPVLMKKGRPGTLVTILTDEQHRSALEDLLLTETTTLGIRIRRDQRTCLDRTHTTVATPYGPVRIKIGTRDGAILNAAPEFEDCRAAAVSHSVPVKQVIQAATAAYLTPRP